MKPSLPLVILFLFAASASLSDAGAGDVSVISHPSKMILPAGRSVEGSPGSRPGAVLSYNRVYIHGFSRLRQPFKYANALKINVSVSQGDALFRIRTIEICFHNNFSIGMGMCPEGQWQKLAKMPWVKSISPYEQMILDIRMPPDPSRSIDVSTKEELLVHRLVFLVLGVVMMVAARSVSKSLVFYYGGAMIFGILLVLLIVLFQGMKLLPTGRKSSLAIFLYSSVVGVGTFLVSYLSGLLRTVLVEIGISEDMHNPLGILLLVCLLLAGAWFGYWGVRKLVLTEEGLVDDSVAYFVDWAICILSAVLILQSSLDTRFAVETLFLIISVLAITKRKRLRFIRRIFRQAKKLFHISRDGHSASRYGQGLDSSDSPNSDWQAPTIYGDDYYSTIHRTPRRRFSKEEWDSFTREQTMNGLRELVMSPDFQRWALDNVERLHVTSPADLQIQARRRRFFRWF